MRHASMKTAQPPPQASERVLETRCDATSSADVAESRSSPRERAVRWNDTFLSRLTDESDDKHGGSLCDK